MKSSPILIFLLRDPVNGFASAFSDALQPNPSSNLRRLDESFELSLERYGIRNTKALGELVHFVDQHGNYKVTLLLLQNKEPPVLACALNEVLVSIVEENLSAPPTVVLPVVISVSKIKLEEKHQSASERDTIYGVQIGPESETTRSLLAKCGKPPPSLQIQYEPLACLLQLACVSKLSICVIIALAGQSQSRKITGDDDTELVQTIGELLASVSSLCFSKEKMCHSTETSKNVKEPWRALYG